MNAVLDASALLAFLHDEAGADQVAASLDSALVSAVNWTEVVQKALQRGVRVEGMATELAEIGVTFEPFTLAQADLAASLWDSTRHAGLSLADRACLALALERGYPVLTADRIWTKLELNLEIALIR